MKNRLKNQRTNVQTTSLTMTSPSRGDGKVRIVGGRWKRSLLEVNRVEGLRPTPERVRETVFDWLTHLWGDFTQKKVCDLFAGSGAMGFEAASRGAAQVCWVDINKGNIEAIKKSAQRLGVTRADGYEALVSDAFAFLGATSTSWDLLIVDPPFAKDWQEKVLEAGRSVIAPEGLIYVERPEGFTPEAVLSNLGLVAIRQTQAGVVCSELLAPQGSQMAQAVKIKKKKLSKVEKAMAKKLGQVNS